MAIDSKSHLTKKQINKNIASVVKAIKPEDQVKADLARYGVYVKVMDVANTNSNNSKVARLRNIVKHGDAAYALLMKLFKKEELDLYYGILHVVKRFYLERGFSPSVYIPSLDELRQRVGGINDNKA